MGLLDTLNQVLAAAQNGQHKDEDIDHVVGQAPKDNLGAGLADAFRAKETPPMAEMVGKMFGNSNNQQQAGLLNQIISAIGPAAAAALAGGVLSKVMTPGSNQVTPEQAAKLNQNEIIDVVNAAEQQQPALADQLGKFYAEHSTLIKTLGGMAAMFALAKMKERMNNNR